MESQYLHALVGQLRWKMALHRRESPASKPFRPHKSPQIPARNTNRNNQPRWSSCSLLIQYTANWLDEIYSCVLTHRCAFVWEEELDDHRRGTTVFSPNVSSVVKSRFAVVVYQHAFHVIALRSFGASWTSPPKQDYVPFLFVGIISISITLVRTICWRNALHSKYLFLHLCSNRAFRWLDCYGKLVPFITYSRSRSARFRFRFGPGGSLDRCVPWERRWGFIFHVFIGTTHVVHLARKLR